MTEATSFSKARWWIAISNTHSFNMLFLRSMKNILRHMEEFLAELMNRLHYFITYSIDWYYNGLDEVCYKLRTLHNNLGRQGWGDYWCFLTSSSFCLHHNTVLLWTHTHQSDNIRCKAPWLHGLKYHLVLPNNNKL